jgi:hypothetical protein
VRAQFLGHGQYDLWVEEKNEDGEVVGKYRPRYIDLYAPVAGTIRYSITKDCSVPADLVMGEFVECVGDAKNAQKVVSNRAVGSVKATFASVQRQGNPNGFVEAPIEELADFPAA